MGKTKLERIIPKEVTVAVWKDHEARYQFAGRFVKDKVVLDVACGAGIGSDYLCRSGARSCTGFDLSPEAIKYARNHYTGPQFSVGDVLRLPVDDESVDVVVSFETIEHVPDPPRFVDECYRVLKPGGLFIGSTPHVPVTRWIYPGDNPFHLQEFTARQLANILSPHFEDVRLYAQDLVVYPAMLAKQLCVRVLNLMGLTDHLLRAMGRSDLFTRSSDTNYKFPDTDAIRPYGLFWLRQPAVTIATATKPANQR
ncbi:MAG TPA: class I SAM-dependent methyltransferase [Candidatus Binataceae bacterium]|nr:class I SAM-dependent methyltransferase [Candidatus Binataceae bacterium]